YPHPPVFGNLLLSFSMTKAGVNTSGTSTANWASVLFFGFPWSFTSMEPLRERLAVDGNAAFCTAVIMAGLPTITLSTSSVRAEETTDQSSYPLKSENAIPLGDFSEYLFLLWPCAKRTTAPKTASAATAVATTVYPAMRCT